MKKATLLMALVLSVTFVAVADDVKIPNDVYVDPAEQTRVECDVTNYVDYTQVEGYVLTTDFEYFLGPLATDAGFEIVDVMLDLDIAQTWIGDLIAELFYDRDNDGTYDVGPVSALCRPNLDGCPWPDDCCGCSADINGVYRFSDQGLESLGDPNCVSPIVPGCFLPAPESMYAFSAFAGEQSGGSFYLRIGDAAAGDDCTLRSWTVWLWDGSGTPTEMTTWGKVKASFK